MYIIHNYKHIQRLKLFQFIRKLFRKKKNNTHFLEFIITISFYYHSKNFIIFILLHFIRNNRLTNTNTNKKINVHFKIFIDFATIDYLQSSNIHK